MERALNVRSFSDGPMPGDEDPEIYRRNHFVPETVCMTDDGILVGCIRQSLYQWSDDLGLTWQPLDGAPNLRPEMYQPWIHHLGDGRIACAGHVGEDNAFGDVDQSLVIHTFTVSVKRQVQIPTLTVERDFDDSLVPRCKHHNSWSTRDATIKRGAGTEPGIGFSCSIRTRNFRSLIPIVPCSCRFT